MLAQKLRLEKIKHTLQCFSQQSGQFYSNLRKTHSYTTITNNLIETEKRTDRYESFSAEAQANTVDDTQH